MLAVRGRVDHSRGTRLKEITMRMNILRSKNFSFLLIGWAIAMRGFPLMLGILANTTILQAQASNGGADVDKQTIQLLLRRIEQLEAADKQLQQRVAQLETAQHGITLEAAAEALAPASAGIEKSQHGLRLDSTSPPVALPSETRTAAQGEAAPSERVDDGKTLLNIRGFGDYGFGGSNQKGTTTAFSLGQVDFFISSNISERFRFVSDLVFEKGVGNAYEEDLERVLLEYRYSDYFKMAFGRDQTAIGYYNLAFRHSSWFQIPTGRPFLFRFEDEGGILPGHIVGASASGQIPTGKLGLHYIAEVGNGRAGAAGAAPVQNFLDENNHKAVDVNVFSRPDAVPGLQVGFSAYRDLLTPPNSPAIHETILNTYVVFARSKFEWLNEGLLIRHASPEPAHVFNTSGFYTQISRGFGSFRPYFRYQYVNAPNNEPIFFPVYNVSVGLQHGPSLGVRYDFRESVAAKLEYDYNELRRVQGINQQAISQLALQVTFAF